MSIFPIILVVLSISLSLLGIGADVKYISSLPHPTHHTAPAVHHTPTPPNPHSHTSPSPSHSYETFTPHMFDLSSFGHFIYGLYSDGENSDLLVAPFDSNNEFSYVMIHPVVKDDPTKRRSILYGYAHHDPHDPHTLHVNISFWPTCHIDIKFHPQSTHMVNPSDKNFITAPRPFYKGFTVIDNSLPRSSCSNTFASYENSAGKNTYMDFSNGVHYDSDHFTSMGFDNSYRFTAQYRVAVTEWMEQWGTKEQKALFNIQLDKGAGF